MSAPIPGLRRVADAPCQHNPELFTSAGPLARAKAKRLCSDCPYRQLCLDNALVIDDDWGIWGGTDPEQRRQMRTRTSAGVNLLAPASPRRTA